MKDTHKLAFIEEASDLLVDLESSLLELENDPGNSELIAKVFRALHTIKGSSAMFDFDDITMFTHDIENVYDHIRNGELKIDKNIIDLTLAARDQINLMLSNSEGKNVDETVTKKIIESFAKIADKLNTGAKKDEKKKERKEIKPVEPEKGKYEIFYIKFKPSEDIFLTGTNPVLLLNELKELGRSIIIIKTDNLPAFDFLNPEKCYLSWEIILKTDKGLDSVKDIFIFIDDTSEITYEKIDKENKLIKEEDFDDFKNLVLDILSTKSVDVIGLLAEFQPSTSAAELKDVQNYFNKKNKDTNESHHASEPSSSIRVSADKLDELVNLVGELVTAQARLSQLAFDSTDSNLISLSEDVERITWSLRDSALNIRMLPIGTTFSKFKRLVRDLSKDLGKEVELTTSGAETELDKTVIEKLNDPLIHIIRNSLDHGIEMPEERKANGKPVMGTIHLSASQSGGNVLIKISDDGKGMNKEKIRTKAIRMGLIQESTELSESELLNLIFASGFSTADKVTNVSGRGVGMDVVKRAIEALRGTVEITSNNTGTTITLKLPLTLAIIDGLLVKIKEENFVVPLSFVDECIELTKKDKQNANGKNLVTVRDDLVPYISLKEKFRMQNDNPDIEQVVLIVYNNMRIGLSVDQVVGQHQTVIKSLGNYYKNIEIISGATVLGDGTVALIIDVPKLILSEITKEQMQYSNVKG